MSAAGCSTSSTSGIYDGIREACRPQIECLELMFNGLAHREGVDEDVRRIASLGARLAQAISEDFDVAMDVIEEHFQDLERKAAHA